MKKIAVMLALLLMVGGMAAPRAEAPVRVVTSFYPVYVIAQNVLKGVEGVELTSLAPSAAGCLHDYQLLASDMKALAQADVLVINGAGMEGYLEAIRQQLPQLPVVDASAGIKLLPAIEYEDDDEHEGHEHDEDADDHDHDHDHDHGEYNSHIWLAPANAAKMADNMAKGLAALLPGQAETMQKNADAYAQTLQSLEEEIRAGLSQVKRRDIVTFHEAFPYFAKAFDLHTVAVIAVEPDQPLPPNVLAEVADKVRAAGNPPLFVEPQYQDNAARVIAQETGALVYALDPVVTGDGALDAYETAMRSNLTVLQEALNK